MKNCRHLRKYMFVLRKNERSKICKILKLERCKGMSILQVSKIATSTQNFSLRVLKCCMMSFLFSFLVFYETFSVRVQRNAARNSITCLITESACARSCLFLLALSVKFAKVMNIRTPSSRKFKSSLTRGPIKPESRA